MGLGGASGGAGAGGALDGANAEILRLRNAFQAREHVEQRAHVGGLFLDPDDFAGVGMRVDGSGNFGFGQRIKLIQEKDGGGSVVAAAALGAEFVANLAAGDEDTLRVADFAIGNECEKSWAGELFKSGRRIGMAEHAFGREDDERFAPKAASLAAQQMKILRGGGRLADVHIAFGSQLHETLDARAGMLGALALVAVGKQEHESGGQTPLVFAGADELVDDDLGAVHEIAELRFPQDEAFGIVAGEAVLKAEAGRFGERGIVNFAEGLRG